ncbi:FAD-binding oxidoreductase [Microbacterium sp. P05]|uniref:FAD-binding oxidoreductase n=1 Tax=Microbacterium sp. P05 TaxID=3366948 RepID=UPI0037476CE3
MIRPGDARYARVRHVYGATGSPGAVVRPTSPEEVIEALAFARDAGSPFAVRSGGHGISSIATNDGGTVIDLGALASIDRLDARTVRLGPGAHWGHVARALHPWGLAISSGDSGDVGVGGLATTGGIGLMGRAHGLTIDSLVRAEILTADGIIRTVSAHENPDLFWAIRGAGANFGIVTSFEFTASTSADVVQAQFAFAVPNLAGFLETWGATVEASPREISAFLYLGGGAQPFAQATVVYAGTDTAAATRALEPFASLPGVVGQRAQVTAYADVPLTTDAPHSGQQRALTHTGLVDHLDRALSRRLATMMSGGAVQMLQIRSAGGAINDVPEDATAYAHRHQNFSVTAISVGARAAFDAAWEPAFALMDGMYLSFESDHAPRHVEDAFPPRTLARLRDLKAIWDPEGIFTQNFDVTARP